jgi:hypothetical protein
MNKEQLDDLKRFLELEKTLAGSPLAVPSALIEIATELKLIRSILEKMIK